MRPLVVIGYCSAFPFSTFSISSFNSFSEISSSSIKEETTPQIGAVEVFTYDLSQGPFFERFFAYNSKILIGFTICFV